MSNLFLEGGMLGVDDSKISDGDFKSSSASRGKNSSKDSEYSGGAGPVDSLWQNSSMQRRSGVGSGANLNLTGASLWGKDSGLLSSEQEESLKGSHAKVESLASSGGGWYKDSSLVRSEDEMKQSMVKNSVKRSKVEEKKITEESNDWTESESSENNAEFIETK